MGEGKGGREDLEGEIEGEKERERVAIIFIITDSCRHHDGSN